MKSLTTDHLGSGILCISLVRKNTHTPRISTQTEICISWTLRMLEVVYKPTYVDLKIPVLTRLYLSTVGNRILVSDFGPLSTLTSPFSRAHISTGYSPEIPCSSQIPHSSPQSIPLIFFSPLSSCRSVFGCLLSQGRSSISLCGLPTHKTKQNKITLSQSGITGLTSHPRHSIE